MCIYKHIYKIFFFQVSSQSVGFGIFTVQLPNNQEENFCIKYYPELYNLTSNKSEAVTFDLNQLYELPQDANTCPDEEDIEDLDPSQIALIPTTNKTINGKENRYLLISLC